jgi:hypothetical protein
VWLNHSFSELQLDWFRAGSALNFWRAARPRSTIRDRADGDQNFAVKPT